MESAMPSSANPDEKIRVIIVDDVLETRRTIRLMLSSDPRVTVVAFAQNGQEAVELTQSHKPDIAFVDVNMPEMDGITAIEKMIQINPDLVCIVVSAEKETRVLQEAMDAGARGYLIKPFAFEEIEAAIQKGLDLRQASLHRNQTVGQIKEQRDKYLKKLGREYIQARRSDDQAMDVFEQIVALPGCETFWHKNLAMMYIVRGKWGKLRALAAQLESQTKQG